LNSFESLAIDLVPATNTQQLNKHMSEYYITQYATFSLKKERGRRRLLFRLKNKLLENSITGRSGDSKPRKNDNTVGRSLHEGHRLLRNVIRRGTKGILNTGYFLFGLQIKQIEIRFRSSK